MKHLTSRNQRRIGLFLCLCAAAFVIGWIWIDLNGETSTDNAYVRGDITSVAPKVTGYVTMVAIEDNQPVQAGDVLFRINDRDYRAKLTQAVANLEAAKAHLTNVDAETKLQYALIRQAAALRDSSEAALGLAIKASDRRRQLIRSSAVSQAQVDEADAKRLQAEAAVSAASATLDSQRLRLSVYAAQREAALAAIAQAEAARQVAQIDLDNTIVHAPVSGIIGNRHVRMGQLVAPGSSLLDIVPVKDVWIVANFKETQVRHIQVGQQVHITIDGYPDEMLEGVVDSLAPGSGSAFSLLPVDNATGNFVHVVQRVPVKIRFARKPLPDRLVPGLSARVAIGSGR
ncbi:MAG: HlyD family secretion protein [Nitrobacter sp.]|jgi:membrane fusion protein (multidrug efflux system)